MNNYKIIVSGDYIALMFNDKKVGHINGRLIEQGKKKGFFKVTGVHIEKEHRGLGLSVKMYESVKDISTK